MAFTVDIRGNASHLEKTIGQARSGLNKLADSAKFGITALAGLGAVGAAGLGAFVISSSKAAASVEDLTIQLGVLTGSTAIAKKMIAEFKAEEIKSSLNLSDYADAAKLLLGFGSAQETVLPLLKQIGDVSLGNSERFGRLALAFGQIQSKGKLAGQELNQLAESGFNPLQIIVEATGKTYGELFEMMEKRTITVAHVSKALELATSQGGRFYKAIEKGSVGTTAKIAQTQAAVTALQVAFGTGFNVGLKNALDATNTFLPVLTEKFTEAGRIIGSSITNAVEGNTEELSAVGAFMGETVWNGFKGFYLKALDNFIVTPAQNSLIVAKEQARLAAVGKPFGMTDAVRNVMAKGGEVASSPTMAYMQTALEETGQSGSLRALKNADIQRQVEVGITTGIQRNMSDAVKRGVLEAMSRQPGGAKFSN